MLATIFRGGPLYGMPMEYAGPAPYLVAGASQINFQAANYPGAIYATLPSGLSQGFQIYVAGQ
jgi:hypothetical protein